jgi:hypothetical protein
MLGAITCLEDTAPGGGNFYYWPRSHLPVHSFFKAKPEFINPNAFPHTFGSTEGLQATPAGYSDEARPNGVLALFSGSVSDLEA